MTGVSTDTALHQMVARIERTLKSGTFGICLVLDVEGAFNSTTVKSMIDGLERNRIDPMSIRWISSMLYNREVGTFTHKTPSLRVAERGCPQGGVLFPLLWNLVVEECLSLVKERHPQIHGQGFADDLGFYGSGIDLGVVTNQMQDAINTVSYWCKSVDLSVDQKVGLMLITNRRKYQTKTLILNGKKLEYMKQIKYLGITIDASLTWVPHVKSKSAKALSALAQCRRAIGSKWGLSPRVTHWIYTAVVLPGVLYGSLVWAPATKFQNKTQKLQRVQSCALRTICGTMKSTPIVALEALLCMPSIDTKIQEHAVASMHRLKLRKHWLSWSQMGSTSKLTHTMLCESIAKEIPEMEFPCDFSQDYLPTESGFNTCIKSRKQWEDEGFPELSETSLVCFTDGSRIHSSTGAAYIAGNNSSGVIPLGTRYCLSGRGNGNLGAC
jgi:hypothetical protein